MQFSPWPECAASQSPRPHCSPSRRPPPSSPLAAPRATSSADSRTSRFPPRILRSEDDLSLSLCNLLPLRWLCVMKEEATGAGIGYAYCLLHSNIQSFMLIKQVCLSASSKLNIQHSGWRFNYLLKKSPKILPKNSSKRLFFTVHYQ